MYKEKDWFAIPQNAKLQTGDYKAEDLPMKGPFTSRKKAVESVGGKTVEPITEGIFQIMKGKGKELHPLYYAVQGSNAHFINTHVDIREIPKPDVYK